MRSGEPSLVHSHGSPYGYTTVPIISTSGGCCLPSFFFNYFYYSFLFYSPCIFFFLSFRSLPRTSSPLPFLLVWATGQTAWILVHQAWLLYIFLWNLFWNSRTGKKVFCRTSLGVTGPVFSSFLQAVVSCRVVCFCYLLCIRWYLVRGSQAWQRSKAKRKGKRRGQPNNAQELSACTHVRSGDKGLASDIAVNRRQSRSLRSPRPPPSRATFFFFLVGLP